MDKKTVVLVIAHEGYQPIEYGVTREVLINKGIQVITASDEAGTAIAKDSSSTHVDVTIDKINPEKIDGLFLIGGSGALTYLNTEPVHTLLQEMMALEKPYGSICISSRILAQANVLGGRNATGWNDDHELEDIFRNYAVTYIQKPVVIDGNVITAVGPQAAHGFGEAIAKLVQS